MWHGTAGFFLLIYLFGRTMERGGGADGQRDGRAQKAAESPMMDGPVLARQWTSPRTHGPCHVLPRNGRDRCFCPALVRIPSFVVFEHLTNAFSTNTSDSGFQFLALSLIRALFN